MRKTALQILSEIRASLDAINGKIAEVELQLAELEGFMEDSELEEEHEIVHVAPAPEQSVPVATPVAAAVETPAEPLKVEEPVAEPAPAEVEVSEPEQEPEPAPVAEPEPEAIQEPVTAPEPEVAQEPVLASAPVDEPVAEEPAAEPEVPVAEEPAIAAELPVVEEPVVPEPEPEPESEPETVPEPVPEPVAETPVLEDPAPVFDLEIDPMEVGIIDSVPSVPNINDIEAVNIQTSVIDVMTADYAWRKDRPASPVRNILSGISLNDRLLFINALFGEDAALFQSTIRQLNEMSDFNEAEKFITTHFSGWNLKSDHVYRFMMAVRRKLS